MGLQLPEVLRECLSWLGLEWPEADESILAGQARDWLTVTTALRGHGNDINRAVHSILDHNQSQALTAFDEFWFGRTSGAFDLTSSELAAGGVGVETGLAAGYVLTLKVVVMAELVAASVAILAAIATDGLSLAVTGDALLEVHERIVQLEEETISLILRLGPMAGHAVRSTLEARSSTLSHRRIHNSAEAITSTESIHDRVAAAAEAPRTTRRAAKVPLIGGPPNGILKRTGPSGQVTSYVVYDADGFAVKRVDLQPGGAPHASAGHHPVPTPHVTTYIWHHGPGGDHQSESPARPVYPEELP